MLRRTREQNICVMETGQVYNQANVHLRSVTSLVAVTISPDKSNLNKFILAHSLRGNNSAGKAFEQEQEATGHTEIAVKQQREMNSGTHWLPPFPLFIESGTLLHRQELHTKGSLLSDSKISNDD